MPSLFYEKHAEEIKALSAYYRKHLLEDIVPFWEKRTADWHGDEGGYFTCFNRQGHCYQTLKPGWFMGRTLYTFSHLYKHFGQKPQWMEIAQAGRNFFSYAYLGDGRFAQMLDAKGQVLTGATSIFTDHFAVKGLYEYIAAFDAKEDIPFAQELSAKLFANVEKPEILRGECPDARFQKHAVNFMTLITALESFQVLENVYSPIVKACAERSLYVFANDHLKAPLEYVGVDGQPLLEGPGRLVDPGHTMESLWFAMKAGEELGVSQWKARAAQVLDWVIDRTWDEEYGGFYQHVDVEHTVPEEPYLQNRYVDTPVAWNDKIWWVQAEGLVALAHSALLNENERHFHYLWKLHEYVKTAFSDSVYGEWYSLLHRDGSCLSDRKGFELKGAYHVPRCAMLLCELMDSYLGAASPVVIPS